MESTCGTKITVYQNAIATATTFSIPIRKRDFIRFKPIRAYLNSLCLGCVGGAHCTERCVTWYKMYLIIEAAQEEGTKK